MISDMLDAGRIWHIGIREMELKRNKMTLKDSQGRVIQMKKYGDMTRFWVDEKYVVIVNKHTPMKEVMLLLEKTP